MTGQILRIGMWSGPRNISTAMMRSFENRADTVVVDEPLYAHYLAYTGIEHPGAEKIMRVHETDWSEVVAALLGPVEQNASVFYQKHMAHHLVADVDRGWIRDLVNVFLIREPREMLTSLIRVLPNPTLEETGLIQQLELFQDLQREFGRAPLVIDSREVLQDPESILGTLCEELGLEFDQAMLSWPSGSRESDGIWAEHWYSAVRESTGFAPYHPKNDGVPDHLEILLRDCRAIYDEMFRFRITP